MPDGSGGVVLPTVHCNRLPRVIGSLQVTERPGGGGRQRPQEIRAERHLACPPTEHRLPLVAFTSVGTHADHRAAARLICVTESVVEGPQSR